MRDEILADLKKDFSNEPEYWDWLARHESSGNRSTQMPNEEISSDHLSKAIRVYEDGLRAVPSATMVKYYVKFLMDAIMHKNEVNQTSENFRKSGCVDLISHLLMIYEKAESLEFISEDLACQHVSFLLQLGKLDEAKKLGEKLCIGMFSNSVQVWALRLLIDMRCIQDQSRSPSIADLSAIFYLLRNFLTKVDNSEAENLWLTAFKYFGHHRHYFDRLVMVALSKHGGSDTGILAFPSLPLL